MKRLVWVAFVVVAVVGVVVIGRGLTRPRPVSAVPEKDVPATKARIADVGRRGRADRLAKETAGKPGNRGKQRVRDARFDADDSDLTPAEQALVDAVQEAMEDENFELTLERAQKALQSSNQEVRQEAVDALGWFDEKALDALSKLMGDKNADLAESARDYVESALDDMEQADFAFAQAVSYLDEYGHHEETAEMLIDVMSFTGSQIIDPDDSDNPDDIADAKENRACIVEVVSSMIEQGGKLAAKGKELYEDISGEEWTGIDDADTWANDIEEPDAEEPDIEEPDAEEPPESSTDTPADGELQGQENAPAQAQQGQ